MPIEEPEYKLDDSVTERDLLFRIVRELTTVSTGNIGTVQSAAANYQANATSIANTDTPDGHHFAALLTSVSGHNGTIQSCTLITTPFPS